MAIKILNKICCTRLTDQEEECLNQLAETLGANTRSRVIRKIIREALALGPDLLKDDLNSFREAVRQVAAVGRNINQIARAVNSGQVLGSVLDPDVLNDLAGKLKTIEKELAALILRSRNRGVRHV